LTPGSVPIRPVSASTPRAQDNWTAVELFEEFRQTGNVAFLELWAEYHKAQPPAEVDHDRRRPVRQVLSTQPAPVVIWAE
jgi:hypothetical protein